MDIKEEVGETAGKVWQLLTQDGPQTLAQAKKKLDVTSELLNFAIGWLAREDKVNVSRDKKDIRVQLK
jgi:predicted ArsR family transcriptional regulator